MADVGEELRVLLVEEHADGEKDSDHERVLHDRRSAVADAVGEPGIEEQRDGGVDHRQREQQLLDERGRRRPVEQAEVDGEMERDAGGGQPPA